MYNIVRKIHLETLQSCWQFSTLRLKHESVISQTQLAELLRVATDCSKVEVHLIN